MLRSTHVTLIWIYSESSVQIPFRSGRDSLPAHCPTARPHRRLDARVRLPGFAELDACRLLLLGCLVDSAHRQTRMRSMILANFSWLSGL